ncbi:hypothetical protein HWV62_39331 [Athelia sp. TMB]|nr:hypothetical protein HWV62_39331 [Athelia sp. TMB]
MENQTGVENKLFKKEQFIEALIDPKTWLFALFTLLDNIPNSLTNQRQIIVSSFGFSSLQTTLLGCVDGIIGAVSILIGMHLATRIKNGRAYVGMLCFIPDLLGVLIVTLLPWSNKVGLLCGVWLTGVSDDLAFTKIATESKDLDLGNYSLVLALSWLSTVTSGHTKRVTVNAIVLSAYAMGVPWIIIGICYLICPMILLAIRYLLAKENNRRDVEPADEMYDAVYIQTTDASGNKTERLVPKAFQDLTDIQNREFRYVL